MPKAFPEEFRRDVIAVARRGDAPVSQIARDFGISEACLHRWLKIQDVEHGVRPGLTQAEQAEVPKMMYPLVLELATDVCPTMDLAAYRDVEIVKVSHPLATERAAEAQYLSFSALRSQAASVLSRPTATVGSALTSLRKSQERIRYSVIAVFAVIVAERG